MTDDSPRRLPPLPSSVQVSIPQPVVPEVTLLWEGEESVYWKPNTPGSKTNNSQLKILPPSVQNNAATGMASSQTTMSRMENGTGSGYAHHSARNVPTVKGASQISSEICQPDANARLLFQDRENSKNFRRANSNQPPAMFPHPSTASMSENSLKNTASYTCSVSQVADAVVQQNKVMAGTGTNATVNSTAAHSKQTHRQYEPENHAVHEHHNAHSVMHTQATNYSRGTRNNTLPHKTLANNMHPQENGERINSPNLAPPALALEHKREYDHATLRRAHYDNSKNPEFSEAEVISKVRHGVKHDEMRTRPDNCEKFQIRGCNEQEMAYNPLSYSSEKKPLKERNTNWYGNYNTTPVAAKESRAIIPRVVDFDSTSADWGNRIVHKENLAPEHPYHSSPDLVIQEQQHNTDRQITPYRALVPQSPIIVNTPDPFLQKIIEGKDQQIFQLHKVLETILSKGESKDRTLSQSSSVSSSPKTVVHKEVSTQTTECSNIGAASQDVGINTELSWPDLLKSLDEKRTNKTESYDRSVDGPSTILKNSSSVRAAVLQRSSNTSSVRFDTDSDHVIESRRTSTTQVQNQAFCYNESRSAVPTPSVERESHHPCGSQQSNGSRARVGTSNGNGARNLDEEAGHKLDELGKNLGSHRGRNNGMLSGNNHREVSLTLREVVLTTIEEDPASPQTSLHLDLPDYPGDTILPQANRAEQTCARGAPARAITDAHSSEQQRMSMEPARQHQNLKAMPRCASDQPLHYRPGTPVIARRVRGESRDDQHCRSKTGVTIYRNVMNNIEQLLEGDRQLEEEFERPNPYRPVQSESSQDTQLTNLEQQLQHFGLSFLDPRALQSRNTLVNSSPASPPDGRKFKPSTSRPREFSVATEEFLRKNGLLEP